MPRALSIRIGAPARLYDDAAARISGEQGQCRTGARERMGVSVIGGRDEFPIRRPWVGASS